MLAFKRHASVRSSANLYSNKRSKLRKFPGRHGALIRSALLATYIVGSLVFSNCRTSNQKDSPKSKMNDSETKAAASDPMSSHRRAIVVDTRADAAQRLVDESV